MSKLLPKKRRDTLVKDTSSNFSKFFREASYAQKRKVFLEVARKASREQLEVIRSVQGIHSK